MLQDKLQSLQSTVIEKDDIIKALCVGAALSGFIYGANFFFSDQYKEQRKNALQLTLNIGGRICMAMSMIEQTIAQAICYVLAPILDILLKPILDLVPR